MKISRRFPRSPRVYVFQACFIVDLGPVSSLARIQIHRTALGPNILFHSQRTDSVIAFVTGRTRTALRKFQASSYSKVASHAGVFRGARISSLPTNACSTEDNIPFQRLANHVVLSKFWKVDLDRRVTR